MAPHSQHEKDKVLAFKSLFPLERLERKIFNCRREALETRSLFSYSLFVIAILSFSFNARFPIPALVLIGVERATEARNCKVQLDK